MILLDTNVLSEVMAPAPEPDVTEWLNRQETPRLFLSTITLAEIGYGLWILPEGKRRRMLTDRFESFLAEAFEGRVLSFNPSAAKEYAEIMGQRRKMGRPMSMADGQIASIARTYRFALATRNLRDFEHTGLELINPFGD